MLLAAAYFERTADAALIREIWPNIKRALNWIDVFGDRDGDGFVEYQQQTEKGLTQQGWKDSQDSVFHSDGRLADAPIALCEVQAYVYAAKRGAASLARVMQDAGPCGETGQQARRNFSRDLTMPSGAMRLIPTRSHWTARRNSAECARPTPVMRCSSASPQRPSEPRVVVEPCMDDHSFCGWGIRTVAAGEARYNPMSYHNGSVWPHDNAIIGLGMARYGYRDEVTRIVDGLHEASRYVEMNRLPELFCGFHRRPETNGPTLYPVACSPQAWAAGSVFMLVQACLGLTIDAPAKRIHFARPVLPSNVDEIQVHRLRVGEGQIDFAVRRVGKETRLDILRKSDSLNIMQG